MIAVRLAYTNTKRVLRHRGLKTAFVALPVMVALARALFAGSTVLRVAAELCPVACLLMIGGVLYTQWSVDAAAGLVAGLRASPISPRALVMSRVLSGIGILAVQMALFGSILAIRF